MSEQKRIRRNIHTYPFKYQYMDPDDFFAPDRAVIYIHIPFCTTKCHFCDYVVYTNTKNDVRRAYVNALCKEIASFPNNKAYPGFVIDAIYVGGGTPGLLETEQLIQILQTCRDTFQITEDCEVAVEFDPACVEEEKVAALYESGYNRLSIGVQSFDEEILRQNNRPHDLESVYTGWEVIQNSGFTHTNIDLIYPLIDLDIETWQDSLHQAVELQPSCITSYPLEVWNKTVYHHWLTKKEKALPDIQVEIAMCSTGFDILEGAGFTRCSTSGYYHPERTAGYCRYLDYYWRTWPLIGFGVSSKSVIYNRLHTNINPMREYIKRIEKGQSIMDFSTNMTKRQEMHRVMIRGLKMCEVSKPAFYDRFGVEMEMVFSKEINDLVERGYLINDTERIYLTRQGQVFSTNVYETFYTELDLRDPAEHEVQFGISELVAG